jgi:predicted small secreted protein
MIRKIVTVFALVGGLAVAGCNTIEGAGEDVKSAGDAVSDAASDAKN